jgi:hypothetical protein
MSQHAPDTYCFQGCTDVSLDDGEMIRLCPLHAAAPELLAVVTELVQGGNCLTHHAIQELGRAVIAKIEGRAS